MTMLVTTTPNAETRYRIETAKAPMSHKRKKCACGKIITAKQLAIYGCCSKCFKEKA